MDCEQLAPLYEEYALGVLEGEERAELEAHLARACDHVHVRESPRRDGSSRNWRTPRPMRSPRRRCEARSWTRSSRPRTRRAAVAPIEKPKLSKPRDVPGVGLDRGGGAGAHHRILDSPDGQSEHASSRELRKADEARNDAEPGAAKSAGRWPHGRLGDDVARFHAAETHAERQEHADGPRLPASAHGRGHHRGSDALHARRRARCSFGLCRKQESR